MPTYGQYDVPSSETMVNLGVGQPDNRKLPLDLIKNSMRKFLDEENNPEVLQYGDIPGYQRFREKLANWLTKKSYSDIDETMFPGNITEDELFITNGVTQALHLIMAAYMYQDDTIFVEDPTYFIMINIFNDFGLDVVPIPMEPDGIDLEKLEERLETLTKIQERVFLYTIPINHNPTGITMSHEKRLLLASLCDTYSNFYVLSDEVYHFLTWEKLSKDEQVLPLADYHPNIVSIGSFSKILAPSLRLGWIYTNRKFDQNQDKNLIKILCESSFYDSTGGTAVLSSYIAESMIDDGSLDEYIETCKSFLSSRCKSICDVLQPYKDQEIIDFEEPIGGYFLWLKTNKINASELLNFSIKNKVKFHPGWKFTSNKENFNDRIRLSFSFYNEEDLKIGSERLMTTILNFEKTKVAVLGSTGKLGSLIVEEVLKNQDLDYIGNINRDIDISFLPQNNCVIIDVSTPEATNNLVKKLISLDLKIPLIIGTTGELDMSLIKNYSNNVPVGIISNFSDGVPILLEISETLRKLPQDWTFHMKEVHHVDKKDKPSGTAKSWRDSLNRNCEIDSIREGDVFGEHELTLKNGNEEITIFHKAKNRKIFAEGSLKYIDWILNQDPGVHFKIDYSKYDSIRTRKYSASGNILMIVEFLKREKWESYIKKEVKNDSKLDGIIFLERSFNNDRQEKETTWTYFNKDGSEASFCGNGIRCIGKYLYENYKELTGNVISPKKIRSTYKTSVEDNYVSFDSPRPINIESSNQIQKIRDLTNQFEFLNIEDIGLVAVGVPHIIINCNCNVFEVDNCIIEYLSTAIQTAVTGNFNVNFVNIVDMDNFNIRTFERGVNAETGSCGSGSLASFYLLHSKKNKLNQQCTVSYLNGWKMNVYLSDGIDKKYYLGGSVDLLSA